MKAKVLLFLSFFSLSLTLLAQEVANYFPMAVGNKWLYLNERKTREFGTDWSTGKTTYEYSVLSINEAIKYNGDFCYKFSGFDNNTFYYDFSSQILYTLVLDFRFVNCNFRLEPGETYQGFLAQCIVDTSSKTIMDSLILTKGYSYILTSPDISPYFCQRLFADHIGLVYTFDYCGDSLSVATEVFTRKLIGFYSADNSLAHSVQDEATPFISAPNITVNNFDYKMRIDVKIGHKYTIQKDSTLTIVQGCSFIESSKIDYFYAKNNDTIRNPEFSLTSETEVNFIGSFDLRQDLINNGYELYYRISATDKALIPHTTYYPESGYTKWDGIVGVEDEIVNPQHFSLNQNYPNPFNPSTTISFNLPKTSFVNLSVYNIIGQKVAELVNQQLNLGEHTINFTASHLNSGVYIYKLTTPQFTDSKKMILVK